MKNTTETFNNWLKHKPKKGKSISTDGQVIKSYQTPILSKIKHKIILNIHSYSKTTSRQQNELKRLLNFNKISYITLD